MITGTNTENRSHRFEVAELVVGGEEITPEMIKSLGGKPAKDAVKIDDVELSGTYKNDHEALQKQLAAVVEALRSAGLAK